MAVHVCCFGLGVFLIGRRPHDFAKRLWRSCAWVAVVVHLSFLVRLDEEEGSISMTNNNDGIVGWDRRNAEVDAPEYRRHGELLLCSIDSV